MTFEVVLKLKPAEELGITFHSEITLQVAQVVQ
jgi:hypothetical protein